MRVVPGVSHPARWLIAATLVAMLASLLPAPGPVAAGGARAAAPFTLVLSASGGAVAASPTGPTYAAGTVVTLTPTPAAGNVLVKWTIDGAPQGWANPKTITMDADHRVDALFAPRPSFSDVAAGSAAYEPITQLAARGIIRGYGADECAARGLARPCFGPGDPIIRAQMAVLIVRSFGWDAENPGGPAPFADLGGVDAELQRAIAILARRGIINGYGDGTYGPFDEVTHAQVISFLTRAMVQAGHWRAATQDDPAIYPGVPAAHRLDVVTFVNYAGPIVGRPVGQPWSEWGAPAPRAWTAAALWQGLDSFFGGTGPRPSGSPTPTPSPSALPSTSPAPGNRAPVATADAYTTAEDTPLVIVAPGVLANDSDPDGNPITAAVVTGPAHGNVTLNLNGSFTYTPSANFNGSDSFTYSATDGAVSSNTATVTITISAVNDAPMNSVPGAQGVVANTALTFSTVNSNTPTITDVDAGTSPVQVALSATNGTLTLSGTVGLSFTIGDGTGDATMTFTGTIAAINAALNGLRFDPTGGYTGPASVRIVTDDQGNTGAGGPLSDDDTVAITVTVGAASTIAIESGNGSTAVVGTTRTLQAKVTDGTNTPVPGYTVTWGIASGGGTFSGTPTTTSVTDGSGIASIVWTIGTTAGAQSATASAPGLIGSPLTFSLTATPDTASLTTSTITANPGSIAAGGSSPSTITVQLKDQYGNSLTTGGGVVSLTTTGGTLTGTGAPGTTVTAIDAGNGTYTATLAAPNTAGSATITGTLGGNNLTGGATVTFTAGPASKYIVTAASSTVTVGTSVTITAQLVDANDNPVATPGLTVTWSSTGGGSFAAPTSATNASGVATVAFTVGTVAGTVHTVTASDGTATGTSGDITTVAGAAAQLAFTQQPTNAVAGVAIAPAVQVAIRDSFGNTVPGATSSISLAMGANPGGGTLGGTTSVSAVNGVATFANLNINRTGTGYTLVASALGLTSATSNPFNITPGVPATFTIEEATSGPIQTQTAGSAFAIKITAFDASGNVATGFAGTVEITSNGTLSAGSGTTVPFSGGVLASHSVTFGVGGTGITITATQTGGTASGTSNPFTVQSPPTAVNDGPLNDATVPGDSYHGFFNQTFTVAAANGLFANDILGVPVATLTSFQVGATAYSGVNIGTPQSVVGGHTLTVNADGSLTFVPASGFTGVFSFDYTISNGTSSTATAKIAVGNRPVATDRTYGGGALIRNVTLDTTATAEKVTFAGDNVTVAVTGNSNGTGTVNADGTYQFLPSPVAPAGPASFTYAVTNGFGTVSATVTFTLSADRIWFVDKSVVASGVGTQASPWKDLNNAAGTAANDTFFLFENGTAYAAGITLQSGQKVIGQDASSPTLANAAGVTPATHQTLPTLNAANATTVVITPASAGTTITLNANNTLRGFRLGNNTTAIAGTTFGTLTVSDVTINTNGQALNLTTGTLNGSFAGITSTGGANNIALTGVATTGTATLGTGTDTLSGATGASIMIDGQNGSFTYTGAIVNTTGTLAADIKNKTGGTVAFSGTINAAAAGRGLSVTGNSAGTTIFSGSSKRFTGLSGTLVNVTFPNGSTATVEFTGGGLDIAGASTAVGFKVAGVDGNDGTVRVQGSNNVIATASGIALDVRHANIGTPAGGEGGLNFRSISANGAASGIVLNNTGGSGGLTVTGAGMAGTGGVIQNTTGDGARLNSTVNASLSWMNFTGNAVGVSNVVNCNANNASGCESAIDLASATNVTLDRIAISGAGQAGVSGESVSGFRMTNSTVLNVGDADGESGLLFRNLSGVSLIQDVTVDNPEEFGIKVFNTTATGDLTLRRVTVQNNIGTFGEAGFQAEVSGGALTVLVDDSDFLNTDGSGVFGTASAAGVLNLTVQNSTFTNNQALPSGINFTTGGNATGRLTATGNTINGCATLCSQGIDLDASISSTLDARVVGNTIANAGIGTGIEFISNENAVGRGYFEGNTVTVQPDKIGMNFQARSVGSTQSGSLDLTLKTNTINGISSAAAAYGGMTFQVGASGALVHDNSMCVNLATSQGAGGNVVNGVNNAPLVYAYTLRQRTGTTFNLQGFTGTGTLDTSVEGFVQGNNTGGTMGGSAEAYAASGTTIVSYTSGTCATPATAPLPSASVAPSDPFAVLPAAPGAAVAVASNAPTARLTGFMLQAYERRQHYGVTVA